MTSPLLKDSETLKPAPTALREDNKDPFNEYTVQNRAS